MKLWRKMFLEGGMRRKLCSSFMLMHPLQQADKKMDKQLTHLITRMIEF